MTASTESRVAIETANDPKHSSKAPRLHLVHDASYAVSYFCHLRGKYVIDKRPEGMTLTLAKAMVAEIADAVVVRLAYEPSHMVQDLRAFLEKRRRPLGVR